MSPPHPRLIVHQLPIVTTVLASQLSLPSGRWQARYPGPDGKLRPAPRTFERKRDASEWLAEKRSEINREEWTDPDAGKIPFGTYGACWLKERDLAETTVERYERILRNHVQPYLGERALSEIKEAGQDKADERSTLTIDQVFAVADAIQPRYRLLVLLGAFTGLWFGEFAALRRRDVELENGQLRVCRSQPELKHGRTITKELKNDDGKRQIAIPDVVIDDLRGHPTLFSETGPDGLVFVGPNGRGLRRRNFHRLWTKALTDSKREAEDGPDRKGHARGTTNDMTS